MFCRNCGNELSTGVSVCEKCGASAQADSVICPASTGSTAPATADSSEKAKQGMSIWQFVLTMFLINLPLVGTIILIVFAFDKNNVIRANYCRAYIIYTCAIIVGVILLIGIGLIILGTVFSDQISSFLSWLGSTFNIVFDLYKGI